MKNFICQSKDLSIRPLERDDLPFLYEIHNNSTYMSYFFERPYISLRELEELYDRNLNRHDELQFVAQEIKSGASVAVVRLLEVDYIDRRAEIDIVVHEKYRGRGYGTQSFLLVVRHAFDDLNLYKVYLQVTPDNHIGISLYKGCGFEEECRLIHHYYINGEYTDVIQMCLFRESWQKLRDKLLSTYGIKANRL